MVDILSDIIKIVVLSSGTDTLLRVDGTRNLEQLQCRITGSQELGLELVHTGVGKQQRRVVVWHTRRGCPEDVLVLLNEKVNKGLTDLVHGPFQLLASCRHGLGRSCSSSSGSSSSDGRGVSNVQTTNALQRGNMNVPTVRARVDVPVGAAGKRRKQVLVGSAKAVALHVGLGLHELVKGLEARGSRYVEGWHVCVSNGNGDGGGGSRTYGER